MHGHILQCRIVSAELGRMLATLKVEVGAHLLRRLVAAEDAVRRLTIRNELVVHDLHARCRLVILLTLQRVARIRHGELEGSLPTVSLLDGLRELLLVGSLLMNRGSISS